jgi:2-octaprenyl-6-methoxyphenol hydroxylase
MPAGIDSSATTVEAAVVGAGPAGQTAAIALAQAGIGTALIAQLTAKDDHRTTALLAGSVTALTTLGIWSACAQEAAPLRVLRIVDDTARLLRAPEVSFAADEIGLDAFGYNIENRHLIAALDARTGALPNLVRVADTVGSLSIDANGATIALAGGGRVSARLVVGADGSRSLCRTAAGIATDKHRYPQAALTLNVTHARSHADTSTEFHGETGPFTIVPLPGNRSSIVCVLDEATAAALTARDDNELSLDLERRAHSLLGRMTAEPGRGLFPLAVETARRFGARRIALVGEAAHVVPPIGAQGLNLGLRDAATIAELVIAARSADEDIGSDALLAHYDDLRRGDVAGRTFAVDILNRSLLSDFIAVQGARGLGLFLMDRFGPLRRAVMREGVAPAASQPRLMRGEALIPR